MESTLNLCLLTQHWYKKATVTTTVPRNFLFAKWEMRWRYSWILMIHSLFEGIYFVDSLNPSELGLSSSIESYPRVKSSLNCYFHYNILRIGWVQRAKLSKSIIVSSLCIQFICFIKPRLLLRLSEQSVHTDMLRPKKFQHRSATLLKKWKYWGEPVGISSQSHAR